MFPRFPHEYQFILPFSISFLLDFFATNLRKYCANRKKMRYFFNLTTLLFDNQQLIFCEKSQNFAIKSQ
jgi:hypothetical protein